MSTDPATPIDPERYGLGLLVGEMGEAAAVAGNALRFGLVTPQTGGATAAYELGAELGDVLAAIDFAVMHGLVDGAQIAEQREHKLRKLLDPDALDNLGRSLAPQPSLHHLGHAVATAAI